MNIIELSNQLNTVVYDQHLLKIIEILKAEAGSDKRLAFLLEYVERQSDEDKKTLLDIAKWVGQDALGLVCSEFDYYSGATDQALDLMVVDNETGEELDGVFHSSPIFYN